MTTMSISIKQHALAAVTVVVFLCSAAHADRVALADGRQFTGEILAAGNVVTILTDEGTVSFDAAEVATIDRNAEATAPAPAPQAENELDSLMAMAEWASENALPASGAASAETFEIDLLRAELALRREQFADAAELFSQLADLTDESQQLRLAAITAVLADHPDGIYTLADDLIIESSYAGGQQQILPAGPASLAHPAVMDQALRELVGEDLLAGSALLAEARAALAVEVDQVEPLCAAATDAFDRADAVVVDIARHYKIETARVRIALLRLLTEQEALRFDEELTALGGEEVTLAEYAGQIRRMLSYLESVQDKLDTVAAIAQPFAAELALDIRWAGQDSLRVERMQATLKRELDDAH